MDNNLLLKHKNDPAWAGVIRLYSGLFDTQDERETFILDLAQTDILLAAKCKTSSIKSEEGVVRKILNQIDQVTTNKEIVTMLRSCIELQEFEEAKTLLKQKGNTGVFATILNMYSNFSLSSLSFIYSIWVSQQSRMSKIQKRVLRRLISQLSNEYNLNAFLNQLMNEASPSNITEIKKITNELSLNLLPNSNTIRTITKLTQTKKPLAIKQALTLISQNKLEKEFDVKSIITKLLEFNSSFAKKHAKTFISQYKLENEFSQSNFINIEQEIRKFLDEANHKSLKQAIKLIAQNSDEGVINLIRDFLKSNPAFLEFATKKVIHYKLLNRFPEFKGEPTIINNPNHKDIVIIEITNIIPSRVFVKIDNETRPASIYIGELSNKRIDNIFDFEYNGKKLHVGQKLTAKIIGIDEQNRINLSLKQL